MSATVHRLFAHSPEPRRDGRGGLANSGDPALIPPANPLIESLRLATAPVLLAQLRILFEQADDTLFQMSERASTDADRKLHFDTMRLLRLQRRRMETEFEQAYADSFVPRGHAGARPRDGDEVDLERFSVQPTEELEERIALGNVATKAEGLHRELLLEIGARVDFLIRDLGVPIARQAFAPEAICNAFKDCTAGLDLELPVKLLLFKLFDRFVASQLSAVYTTALKVFDQQSIRPASAAGAATALAFFGPEFINLPGHDATTPELTHPGVDVETRQALEQLSQSLAGYRPLDAQLASELALCAAPAAGTASDVRTVAVAQCLSLVGQMCNEILTDPHLPAPMRPLFEKLRFPLIKISLADGSFFANRGHPVRRLLAEAAETAQTSRTSSQAVARSQEERLRHIAEQIDLSAAFVRPQIDGLAALPAASITRFLDQQRAESETRRETVLNKVRRAVAQELEVHTLGRTLAAPLTNFLRAGWGPLMAARLLRHGASSRMWIDAVNRLVQILASMDALVVTQDLLSVRRELMDAVIEDLAEIGMREDRRDNAVEQLRKAYSDLDEKVLRMTPADRAKAEFESFTSVEHSMLLAEFPAPGSPATRAPAAEARHEARQELPLQEPVLHAVTPTPTPETAAIMRPAMTAVAPPAPVIIVPATTPGPAAAPPEPGGESPGQSADQVELLALCLTSESWFRVFDSERGQTLWLKVSRYYREHDSVGFTGFDAKKTLSVRASKVLEDLIAGRTEPVNPSPAQSRALARLRGQHP